MSRTVAVPTLLTITTLHRAAFLAVWGGNSWESSEQPRKGIDPLQPAGLPTHLVSRPPISSIVAWRASTWPINRTTQTGTAFAQPVYPQRGVPEVRTPIG